MIALIPTWMNDSLPCVGRGDLFFPEVETGETVAPAREICATCDCRLACLDASLDEEWGVWGGLAAWERKPLRYRLARTFTRLVPEIDPAVDTLACALSRSMSWVL